MNRRPGATRQPEAKGLVAMRARCTRAPRHYLATLTSDAALGWQYYEDLAANEARAKGGNGGTLKAVAGGESSTEW